MRIKFKLYNDDDGEPQVKMANPDLPTNHYWREDGKLSFLRAMADDPDSPIEELGDGAYWVPKI